MADGNGTVKVEATIDEGLKKAVAKMQTEVQSILSIVNQLNKSSMQTANGLDAINKALGRGTDASSSYDRATGNLLKNQSVLAQYFKNTAVTVEKLEQQLRALNSTTGQNSSVSDSQKKSLEGLVGSLNSQLAVQKQISRYSLVQDYKKQAAALTDLSTKYSQAGTRISLAITAPMFAFARNAFSNFKRLEVETVRTTKLIGDSYIKAANVASIAGAKLSKDGLSYTQVVNGQIQSVKTFEGAMKELSLSLDAITYKYGISRELVQGLAGDYAELGINSSETLSSLVDLTAATEKLGNVDITESQNFIKSIYQTVMRTNRETGQMLDYGEAVKQVTGQLAMFNLVENKTSLSLNEIAKGFPELTAASTSFGLSMTEAAALLTPMVSAGFQLGASANSVKVSLQRLVAMTQKNKDIIQELGMTQEDFNFKAGVGISTIQKLTDSYAGLKKTKGEQGALEFFSELFGVRQGPRMEVAIQNLSHFQEQLSDITSEEGKLASVMQDFIQKSTAGLAPQYSKMQIKKFEDLSKVVRLTQSNDPKIAAAFSKGRSDFAKYLKEQAESGNDAIAKIQTESGRALFVAAAGGGPESEAARKFLDEVNASLDTAETRYNRAREIIKQIGRQVVPILSELLKVFTPIIKMIATLLEKIGPVGRVLVGVGALMLMAIGPVMKMASAFFQMKSAALSIKAANPFGRFRRQSQEVSEQFVRSNELLFKMKGSLTQMGNKFFLSATVKEMKLIDKLINAQNQGLKGQVEVRRIMKKLGMDRRDSDFTGLLPGYKESIMAGFSDEGSLDVLDKFRKEFFDDFGNIVPTIVTESKAIGTGIAEAFLAALNVFGFDTASVNKPPKTPKPFFPTPTGGPINPSGPSGGGSGSGGTRPGGRITPGGSGSGGSGATAPAPPQPAPSQGTSPAQQQAPAPQQQPAPSPAPAKKPVKSIPDPAAVLKKLQERAQKIYDAAMNPTEDALKALNDAQLKIIAGLFKIKNVGSKAPTALRTQIMEAFDSGKRVQATFDEIMDKLSGGKAKGGKTTRGPTTKVEDAVDEVTDSVAVSTEEAIVETIVETGNKAEDKVKKPRKPKDNSKKVEDASEKAIDDVVEEQDKVTAGAVKEKGKKDTATVRTVKPKTANGSVNLKATVEDAMASLTGVYEQLGPALNLDEVLTPFKNIQNIDLLKLKPFELVEILQRFRTEVIEKLEAEQKKVATAQKQAFDIVEKTSVSGYAEIISVLGDKKLFAKGFFDVKTLRGLIPELSQMTMKQSELTINKIETALRSLVSDGATEEGIANFKKRLTDSKLALSGDIREFASIVINALYSKVDDKGTSAEEKAGISTMLSELIKFKNNMAVAVTSIAEGVIVDGQREIGIGVRSARTSGKLSNIKTTLGSLIFNRTSSFERDASEKDQGQGYAQSTYDDAQGSISDMGKIADDILSARKSKKEIESEIDSLQFDIEQDQKSIEMISSALSNAKKINLGDIGLEKRIYEPIRKAIEEREQGIEQTKLAITRLESDSSGTTSFAGVTELSTLDKILKFKEMFEQVKNLVRIADEQVKVQFEKLEETKRSELAIIEASVSRQKAELSKATSDAESFAAENTGKMAEAVDSLNIAREELNTLISKDLSSQEHSEFQRLINQKAGEYNRARQLVSKITDPSSRRQATEAADELRRQLENLENSYKEASPLTPIIELKKKEVEDIKLVIQQMEASSRIPSVVSEETMNRNAINEYQTKLQEEEMALAKLETARKDRYRNLKVYFGANGKLNGMIDAVTSAISAGKLNFLATETTDIGFENLIARIEKEKKEFITYSINIENQRKRILAAFRNRDSGMEDLVGIQYVSYESLLEAANLLASRGETSRKDLNRTKRQLSDSKKALAKDPSNEELQQAVAQGEEFVKITTLRYESIIDSINALESQASKSFGKTIFEDPKTKIVIGSGVKQDLSAGISNTISKISKNASTDISEKIAKLTDSLQELGDLGFETRGVDLKPLGRTKKTGEQKLRLTSKVFENIGKEFGVSIPPVFEELGRILEETDFIFSSPKKAMLFVQRLLEGIQPAKSMGAKTYDDELSLLENVRAMDEIAMLLSKEASDINVSKLFPDQKDTKKFIELIKKAAGQQVTRARGSGRTDEQQEILESLERLNTTREELDGELSQFEYTRRLYIIDVLQYLKQESGIDILRNKLADEISKMENGFAGLGSGDTRQITREITRLEKEIADGERKQRQLKIQIDNRISQQLIDIRKRAANSYSKIGAFDVKKLTMEQLAVRKEANPYLQVRPQEISKDMSDLRLLVIQKIKELNKTKDKVLRESIESEINELTSIIQQEYATKKVANINVVQGFLRRAEEIERVPAELLSAGERRIAFVAEQIKQAIAQAEQSGGLDESKFLNIIAGTASLVRGLQEAMFTEMLDLEKVRGSIETTPELTIPFTPLASLVRQPKSLSAAANNPIENTLIEKLGGDLFKGIGFLGQEIGDAINAYMQTLVETREHLNNVALSPVAEMESQMVILREALATIGLTLEQAIQSPVDALTLMSDRTKNELGKAKNAAFAAIERKNDIVKLFRTLALFARDAADTTIEEAIKGSTRRLGEVKEEAKEPAPKKARKGLFPGLERKQKKPLIEALAKEVKIFGLSVELLQKATADELQLLAGYLLKGEKKLNEKENLVEVASRDATDTIDKATDVILKYFRTIHESYNYVSLDIAGKPLPAPAELKPKVTPGNKVKDEVTKAVEKLDDVSKKITDDFISDLNILTASVSQATSGQIPMLEVPALEQKIQETKSNIAIVFDILLSPLEEFNNAVVLAGTEEAWKPTEVLQDIFKAFKHLPTVSNEVLQKTLQEIDYAIDAIKNNTGNFDLYEIAEMMGVNLKDTLDFYRNKLAKAIDPSNISIPDTTTSVDNIAIMLNSIGELINESLAMTLDDLIALLDLINTLPQSAKANFESTLGIPIANAIALIEELIVEKVKQMENGLYSSLIPIQNTDLTVADYFAKIEAGLERIASDPLTFDFSGIENSMNKLVQDISTMTEDELATLSKYIYDIADNDAILDNITDDTFLNLKRIFDVVLDQIKAMREAAEEAAKKAAAATPATVAPTSTPPSGAKPAPTPAPAAGASGGGARPPRVPAGGAPLGQFGPPNPANYNFMYGGLATTNALKNMMLALKKAAPQLTLAFGNLLGAIFKVYFAVTKAVFKFIPFGGTILNLGTGIFNLTKKMASAGQAAAKGKKGLDGFISGIIAAGSAAQKSIVNSIGGGLSRLVPGSSARRGGGNLIGNQASMVAGMVGSSGGMLGMVGGNVLQGLVQSLSAIPVVGTPAVLLFSALTGGVMALSKTTGAWKNTNKDTFKNFKDGLESLKRIARALITPFEDFFGVLLGGTDETKTGTDKARDALQSFSEWFSKTMVKVEKFIIEKVVPALRTALTVVLVLINNLKPVIGGLFSYISAKIDLATKERKLKVKIEESKKTTYTTGSSGEFRQKEASDEAIADATTAVEQAKKKLAEIGKALGESFQKLTRVIGILVKGMLMSFLNNALTWFIQGVVNILEQAVILIMHSIRLLAEAIIDTFAFMARTVVNIIPTILAGFVKLLGSVGGIIGKIIRATGNIPGLGFLKDIGNDIIATGDQMMNTEIHWFDGILDAIDNTAEGAKGKLGNLVDGINAKIGSTSNLFNKLNNATQDAIKRETAGEIKALFAGVMPEGAGKGLLKSVSSLLKQAFANPDAANAAGEALRSALDNIKDAKVKARIEFDESALSAVSGALGNALGKIKDDLTKELNKQKEASLKVFDDQIAAIEALADAEAELTATEEYESSRRQRIRDRELQRNNYQKERSLAIYEGRIDDARSLDLEELKNSEDFTKEIKDLDTGRQKDLQSKNRANAIKVIQAQKDEASKLFDDSIAEFEEYVANLLENGTFTEAQFTEQWKNISEKATGTSSAINTAFTSLFSSLAGKIKTGMDPVTSSAGFFSTGLDALVATASAKFGLSTGVSNPNSILGIASGMLTGLGISAQSAFGAGGPIQTAYGKGLNSVLEYVKEKASGTGENSISSVFSKAIADAAAKMVAEAESKKPEVAAAAGKLVTSINDELAKIKKDSIAKAVADATKQGIDAIDKAKTDIQNAASGSGSGAGGTAGAKKAIGWWYRRGNKGPEGWIKADDKDLSFVQKLDRVRFRVIYSPNVKPTFFKGGRMAYSNGGPTFGPMNQGIPATLHGGEFVLRKSAVDKYGLDMLNQMNRGVYMPQIPRFNIPMSSYAKIASAGSQQQVSSSESTHNYNFYVDNFIGETEWFNSMMKDYNMKVVPANQKQAGLESRVIRTYNGLNRGL